MILANIKREWVKISVLSTIGIYLLGLILSGHLSNIINMRFVWLVYISVIMLLASSILQLVRVVKKQTDGRQYSSLTVLIVALPLIFAIIFPAQPEAIDVVSGRISIEPLAEISTTVQGYIPPADRNVLDWLGAFDSVDNPAELEGLAVDIVAFVYREPGMPENQFMAARLISSGFGANNQAVGMPVEIGFASEWEDGIWVDIQGRLAVGEFRGEQAPVLIPDSITETEAPDDHINNHDHSH